MPLGNSFPCKTFLPRSSYYYTRKAMGRDKYAAQRERIREIFTSNGSCYGSERVHLALKAEGTRLSEKVVRRLMKEERLRPYVPKKARRYNSYKGRDKP